MNREQFLICQYRKKPRALGTISAIYKETDSTFENVTQVADILSIDDASGYALDLIGRHVGVSRVLPKAIEKQFFGWLEDESALPFDVGEFYRLGDSLTESVVLSDDDYRFFIKAKIAKNYQTGEIENIVKSIRFVIDKDSNVIDLQDMSMNILVNNDNLNSLKLYAITELDILARPVGVMYKHVVLVNDQPFGFAHDEEAYGFGFGQFVRLKDIGIDNDNTK